jgi:rubrerythrin
MAGAPQPAEKPSDRDSRAELVALLRLAYSGELAAAHAYRGHARSVTDAAERRRIEEIEAEEWHHRELVGAMLAGLGERPSRMRELRAALVGRTLGILCHFSGWLAPMYGAGRLESRNIREYEAAARLAHACERDEWIDCLLGMAEVEWEHEQYFRDRVLTHRWAHRLPMWRVPPPKETIRSSIRMFPARTRADQASSAPEAASVSST